MHQIMSCVIVASWLIVAGRLVSYQRNGARYRFGISALAWALMTGAFTRAVMIAVENQPSHWSEVAIAATLAALTVRSRGNVACMISRRA